MMEKCRQGSSQTHPLGRGGRSMSHGKKIKKVVEGLGVICNNNQ